jgi:hypothetical protein
MSYLPWKDYIRIRATAVCFAKTPDGRAALALPARGENSDPITSPRADHNGDPPWRVHPRREDLDSNMVRLGLFQHLKMAIVRFAENSEFLSENAWTNLVNGLRRGSPA